MFIREKKTTKVSRVLVVFCEVSLCIGMAHAACLYIYAYVNFKCFFLERDKNFEVRSCLFYFILFF